MGNVDLSVFGRQQTVLDHQRLQEEFEARKMQALQAATGQAPAAVKLANEIQAARAAGDTQRLNDLQMSAKLLDRGVVYDQMGNPMAMGGYGNAVGQIAGAKSMYEQNAQNQSDLAYKPDIARGIAMEQAGVDMTYKPQLEAMTQRQKDMQTLLSEKATGYEDFLQNKLPSARSKTEQALATVQGMRGEGGKGLSPDIQAVVGARNPFRGAIPGTQDADNPGLPKVFAGTPAASGAAKIKQAQGQIFLEAYESLRGAGALTNIEGQKGEQAKARLSAAQNESDFVKALTELEEVLQSSSERLGAKEAEANQYMQQYLGSQRENQMNNIQPLSMDQLNYDYPVEALPPIPRDADPVGLMDQAQTEFNNKKKPRLKYNPATGEFE